MSKKKSLFGSFFDATMDIADSITKDISKEADKKYKEFNRFAKEAIELGQDIANDVASDFNKEYRNFEKHSKKTYSTVSKFANEGIRNGQAIAAETYEFASDIATEGITKGKEFALESYSFAKEMVSVVVNQLITIFTIRSKAKEQDPRAFRAVIMQKKKNAVDVGIFDKNRNMTNRMEIRSSQGISNDIRKGQVIDL